MGRFSDVFGIGPKPKPEDEISEADARMGVTARTTMRRSDYIPGTAVKPEEKPTQMGPNGLPPGICSYAEAAAALGVDVQFIAGLVASGRIRRVPRSELAGVGVFRRASGTVYRADLMGLWSHAVQ